MAKGSSSTTYAYDGLGRNLTATTKSFAGTTTTRNSYTGLDVAETTTNTVMSILVRDPLDQVALQSTAPGGTSSGPAWDLQDRLGSTTAQTNPTGAVTDLATYSDFGIPSYTTTGYSAATGYTGVASNPTTGLTSFHARTYDPQAGTWLSSDPSSGTLTDPGSQNHYGYAGSNPTTNIDAYGYSTVRVLDTGGAASTPVSSAWQHMSADSLEREVNRNPTGNAAVAAHTASTASKVSKRHESVSGWDVFNTVIQFPGNVVEGVLLAGASAINGLWNQSVVNYLLQAAFLGPKTALKNATATLTNDVYSAVQLVTDPGPTLVSIGKSLIDWDEWSTNPGHALGAVLFNVGTLAIPGAEGVTGLEAGVKGLSVVTKAEDAEAVIASTVNATISAQRQARHVLGDPLYNGGGYFSTASDAQQVLDAFHSGKAELVRTAANGNLIVRDKKVTGYNTNVGSGYIGQPTHLFMIKGTKSVSVVPISPGG